jgi:uncharacterized protein
MTATTGTTTPGSPREVFARFQQRILDGDLGEPGGLDALCADDMVVELPFARPGSPRRFDGRAAFAAYADPRRSALPVRFSEFRNVVVHDTTDPEVIVAEYELAGTVTTTNRSAAAPFVLVLRVRDGKIVHLREYQDVLAIAAAVGELP